MRDGDMCASYDGWYGVGGDVYATGGEPEWEGGGSVRFLVFGGWNLGVVVAAGEVRGGFRVPSIGLTDRETSALSSPFSG